MGRREYSGDNEKQKNNKSGGTRKRTNALRSDETDPVEPSKVERIPVGGVDIRLFTSRRYLFYRMCCEISSFLTNLNVSIAFIYVISLSGNAVDVTGDLPPTRVRGRYENGLFDRGGPRYVRVLLQSSRL